MIRSSRLGPEADTRKKEGLTAREIGAESADSALQLFLAMNVLGMTAVKPVCLLRT